MRIIKTKNIETNSYGTEGVVVHPVRVTPTKLRCVIFDYIFMNYYDVEPRHLT